jgi:hypothetical protein
MGNQKKVGDSLVVDTWTTCNALVFFLDSFFFPKAGHLLVGINSKKLIDHNLQQKQQYFSI